MMTPEQRLDELFSVVEDILDELATIPDPSGDERYLTHIRQRLSKARWS